MVGLTAIGFGGCLCTANSPGSQSWAVYYINGENRRSTLQNSRRYTGTLLQSSRVISRQLCSVSRKSAFTYFIALVRYIHTPHSK